jgi:hypothetical protein
MVIACRLSLVCSEFLGLFPLFPCAFRAICRIFALLACTAFYFFRQKYCQVYKFPFEDECECSLFILDLLDKTRFLRV